MDVRSIDANALKQKKTILWDEALGFCECVLVDDIDEAPTIIPEIQFLECSIDKKTLIPTMVVQINDRTLTFSAPAIDETPSRERWIPVTERLPEYEKPVLGWDAELRDMGIVNFVYGQFFDIIDMSKVNVTHWMPLPEPPKEVSDHE